VLGRKGIGNGKGEGGGHVLEVENGSKVVFFLFREIRGKGSHLREGLLILRVFCFNSLNKVWKPVYL
jgi:hypothetical protein